MSSTAAIVPPRRRIWPWVVSFGLALFIIIGAVAFSFLTLDSDGAALRKQMMAATHENWHTKVQVSVGRITLSLARAGLSFVKHEDMTDARLALSSIRCASVGVYTRPATGNTFWSQQQIFFGTDKMMNRRGWMRLIGATGTSESVLVYVPQDAPEDGPIDICVSVLGERDLVVVTGTVSADGLAELVQRHAGNEMVRDLKLAKF